MKCPRCRAVFLDVVDEVEGRVRPEPFDVLMCDHCGALVWLDDHLEPDSIPPDLVEDLLADPVRRATFVRLRSMITARTN